MGLNITSEIHTRRGYRFGRFVLDLDRAQLFQGGELVKLRRQSFDVLRYLVDRNGLLVEKSELLRAIWGEAEVTEDSLTQCIIDIRKALGDFDRNMVQTVPRRGFVFEAPVEPISSAAKSVTFKRVAMSMGGGVALAVLVIGAISLFLGDYRNDAIRDSANPDREAQNHYLQAQFLFQRRAPGDLMIARDSFQQAIERAPDFAEAWAGLSGTFSVEWYESGSTDSELLAMQKAAAEKAVLLDPELAMGWARLSGYYYAVGKNEMAAGYLERAVELSPDDPLILSILAGRHAIRGEHGRAIGLQRRALVIDPLSFINRGNLSIFLFAAGRYEEAFAEIRRAYQIHPISSTQPDTLQGQILIMLHRYEEALDLIDVWPEGPGKYAASAMAHHKLGNEHKAAAAVELLVYSTSPDAYLRRAELLAFCGEIDRSFAALTEMQEILSADKGTRLQQLAMMDDIYLSPFLTPLRADPRWVPWLSSVRTMTVAQR